MSKIKIAVFVLTKNEEKNIARCLESLVNSGWPVYILDSGSSDSTREIVSRYPFAEVKNYRYTNHCNAYNEILETIARSFQFAVILDSDMALSDELQKELDKKFDEQNRVWKALEAEIEMHVEGRALKRASLYPPKPFVFETGSALFVSTGHAEKLINEVCIHRTKNKLMHDDRKTYNNYLQSQFRYSNSLIERYYQGNVSGRDKIRIKGPLLIFAVPFVSFVIKRGFMDGWAGVIYALDRLIAEAIMYRQALASRINEHKEKI